MKKSNTRPSKAIKVLFLTLLILALLIGSFSTFILIGKGKVLNIELKGVALQSVEDGSYVGDYSGYRWSNTVEVTVRNHQITGITVKKPQLFAKSETIQELTSRVIAEQTTEVDAVSGATADSKAFLHAVENALMQK